MIAAALCAVSMTGGLPAPDVDCTPGAYRHITRQQVCTSKPRAYVPVRIHRTVLRRYGLPTRLPYRGKFDHRVPHFLGGRDGARNLWPAPTRRTPKDDLETSVYHRVCHSSPRPMTVRRARLIFQRDWRVVYRKWTRAGTL